MTPVLYKYKHTLSLNFTMLRNPCWTHYFTNFYKIWFLHWVSLSNFIFISFFQKCSYKAVKCLYFLRQGLIWCCMHCHARLFISRSISSSPCEPICCWCKVSLRNAHFVYILAFGHSSLGLKGPFWQQIRCLTSWGL